MRNPEPLSTTFDELRKTNPVGYDIMMIIIREFITNGIHTIPKLREVANTWGLEKYEEIMFQLFEGGHFRIFHSEEDDRYYIKMWDGEGYVNV